MFKKWELKIKTETSLNLIVAWLTVVVYGVFQHAAFREFWPSIIALYGLHAGQKAILGNPPELHHD